MPGTVLTRYQSACRAAHQQVQMLQALYEHLAAKENLRAVASIDIDGRIRELRSFEKTLAAKLEEQELLPMQPDPEKEGLLELFTDVKAALGDVDRPPADERMTIEESELLDLTEQMLAHDDDAEVAEAAVAIREALVGLAAPEPDNGE